nr:hypothetical protein [Angustibacter aerolatus]
MDVPWRALPKKAKDALLHGENYEVHVRYRNRFGRERSYTTGFEGAIPFVQRRHGETDSEWSRERYEGYMREIPCPTCKGARLKPEVLAVLVGGRSIAEACALPIRECAAYLAELEPVAARAPHRRRRAEGDQRPPGLPARRRARLPLARPPVRHAVRRRGAAHPAGDADRLRPGRRALRARRAEHRVAPARQPPADRHPHPAARPRQHADRRRARRGHHPGERLGGRHRPGRRRARRPRRALRHRAGSARARDLADRSVPVPPSRDRDAGRPSSDRPQAAGDRGGRPRAQPARHRRVDPAGLLRLGHRGVRLGQVDAGQRHPLQRHGQQA